jgi:hypothetical protein
MCSFLQWHNPYCSSALFLLALEDHDFSVVDDFVETRNYYHLLAYALADYTGVAALDDLELDFQAGQI